MKTKTSKTKSIREEFRKRVEQFDLLTSIAQTPTELTQEQLIRGDADRLKAGLRKVLSGKVLSSALAINPSTAPQRHQVVRIQVYSEDTHALLDSGAIPNIISAQMVEKINLELKPTQRSIKVSNGSTERWSGIAKIVPVRFGEITVYLDFFVLPEVPYKVIIGATSLTDNRARIDMYDQYVKIRHKGKTEIINFEYDHSEDIYDEVEFTSCSESDSLESSNDSGEEFIITLTNAYMESSESKLGKR